MRVNIIKKRNSIIGDNYYSLEVQAEKGFTKEEYERIREAVQVIVGIMNPKILKELAKRKKKADPNSAIREEK